MDVKLEAIEKAIVSESGKSALEKIKEDYQQEMLKRIMQQKEAD